MVHPLFIGLGIIYLGFTMFLLFVLFREDRESERREREAAFQQTVMVDLGDQSDTNV